jgi:hypothetical protein
MRRRPESRQSLCKIVEARQRACPRVRGEHLPVVQLLKLAVLSQQHGQSEEAWNQRRRTWLNDNRSTVLEPRKKLLVRTLGHPVIGENPGQAGSQVRRMELHDKLETLSPQCLSCLDEVTNEIAYVVKYRSCLNQGGIDIHDFPARARFL